MFKKSITIAILAIVFYFMSKDFYTVSERRALRAFLIMGSFIAIIVSPSISSKHYQSKINKKEEFEVLDRELEEGEYHNDFRRVGSANDYNKK